MVAAQIKEIKGLYTYHLVTEVFVISFVIDSASFWVKNLEFLDFILC